MRQDPYSVLGVAPTAEPAEIRAAYRALMRRYHPDADPGGEAAKRSREINAAYAVLNNPERRAAYDESALNQRRIRFEPMAPDVTVIPSRFPLGPAAAILIAVVAAGMIAFAISPPVQLPFAQETRRVFQPLSRPGTPPRPKLKQADICADREVNGLVRQELFRRAARLRPEAAVRLQQVETHALARITPRNGSGMSSKEEPCSGWLSLDIPPDVAVDGGRTNLNAEIEFALTRAAGSLQLTSLSGADRTIRSLATIGPAPKEPDPPAAIEPAEIAASGAKAHREAAVATVPDRPKAVAARPRTQVAETSAPKESGPCAGVAARTERMICENTNLASLDRQLASFYRQSWAQADERKRSALLGSRQRFNDRRNACASPNCMTTAYVSRLREIGDIMAGRTQP